MNPSSAFIRRPIGTTLLMIAILLAGIAAYRFLPLSALPEVDYPTIQVQTFYPGASPEVVTSAVTAPLETQFGQMPSLKQMSSASSAGASVINLQFDLGLDLDIAEQEVQAAINGAGSILPSDLPAPPLYAKINPADAPVLTIAVTSATLPLSAVEDIADTRLAQKISQLPGVGVVTVNSGERPAVRIHANMQALAAYGLNIDDLRTVIGNANVNTPKGGFDGPSRAYTINANDQLQSAASYRDIVLAYRNGAAVRLSDVASVDDSVENTKQAAWANRAPAVVLNIRRQPNANTIRVVDSIKAMLPQLRAGLPAAVDMVPLTDRTNTIRASVRDVEFELALSVGLVVLVIFLFLRNLPATFIPSLAMPISLVGTFGVMYLAGFSLNNLSLMSLTIASGFVVDDAIVMIENVVRYLEEGETPLEAALKGSAQIGFTIVSLTVSLIAVLIPLLFMGDVVGRLFHEFAITLAVTIVISAIVSLTLVPMLCSKLLRHQPAADQSRIARLANDWFDALIRGYDRILRWVFDHQAFTLLVAVATLALTIALYIVVPKGFFPEQDTSLIEATSVAPQSISFPAMATRQQALADVILKDPDVLSLSSFVGVDGSNPTLNTGRFLINLKPREARRATVDDIIHRLQESITSVEGISLYMQPVQELTMDATVSSTQYQYMLQDVDPSEFEKWIPRLVDKLHQLPEIEDVADDFQNQGLSTYIEVDRATAARFGITSATIDNALYDAFGQRIISTIFTQSNQYRVILEADPAMQQSVASLQTIYLPSALSSSGQVPLSAIARFEQRTAPLQINHHDQFPTVTISFNLAPGYALSQATQAIETATQSLGLPASMTSSFQGAALAFQQSLDNDLMLIVAAIVTVYIILGVLYESFIHPITILSTLPSAGIGALLALIILHRDLDILGIIGIILLVGIVKKNAIMMVDFALNAQREEGKTPREAIHQACLLRFRPILMTTMAALLSALPLMLGGGTGAELRQPLGITIIGGLIASQILTLFTTPVIYLAFDRLSHLRRGNAQRPTGPLPQARS